VHRTNIELDEKLVKEAQKLTSIKTKKEVVDFALRELVRKARRKDLLKLEGAVKWSGDLARLRKSRA
jgi:Arc/MetJ family transcription regulator